MRQRPSSRLLVLDEDNHILLFEFAFKDSSMEFPEFWATPGGELDPGETFEAAAVRELFEETGIKIDKVGPCVAERQFVLTMPKGEKVEAIEKFFVVRLSSRNLSYDNHTPLERQVMTNHKWWHIDELSTTNATVFPNDIVDIVRGLNSQHPLNSSVERP